MDFLFELINNYCVIVLLIVVFPVSIVCIALFKKMMHGRKKNKELTQAVEDKIRDENLNNIILNNCAQGGNFKEIYKPYDVDYSNSNDESNKSIKEYDKKGERHVMIQIVEKTKLSTRKFMMNPMKKIHIGSDLQDNDITVLAEGVSPKQCEIFSVGKKVYIRNLGFGNKTILKRKKESVIVDEKGIRLLTDDVIILGSVLYDITIID